MMVRFYPAMVFLGLTLLSVAATPGCDRFFGKTATTQSATKTEAAPVAPQPTEIGVGNLQSSSMGQGNVAAIFIANRLGDAYKDKILPLQDYVVAESNSVGYSCITLENALESITPSDMDRVLKSESSRLALVRNLNANYLLAVNLTSYDEAVVEKTVYDVKVSQKTYTLALTYQVADRNLGGSIDGGTVTVSKEIPKTPNLSTTSDPFNELLRRGASELAQKFKRNLPPPPPLNMTQFTIEARVQSFDVPNIVKNDKGEYVVSSEKFHLLAPGATITLDGSAVGTTPRVFRAPKGMHKLRISRDGCRSWESNITINDGTEFVVDLPLTDESIQRWKAMGEYLAKLKNNEKLTDAQVKVLEGHAQMFRQSGLKVDVKSNDLKSLSVGRFFWAD